ncbi:hypothetical protein MCOR27_010612 [Pyricularia oryzae]|uniref:Uncharacterized protein n=1 Tax=Pyricularia oryzae TaxID=318829 RepID=A0A4P7NQW9_PYROR|nr:hypothetical protein MCOR01_003256 [Pyricularia oryzae]KAI6264698.1 hypothetical protein MCOR26_011178 [Pyricularia oryzae]KAI6267362.1 hypothetical protein MCOR27_010612 [Pyricularia oryzae]KAI6311384.1 hypothetical protein MCOR30_010847 [Pyricularia oryzae]KAI6372158.1 hypothetical protein MCOR31_003808 [Pyricularia oryzae]
MQVRVPGTNDGLKVFVLSLIGELSGSLAAYSLLLYAAATQKSRSSAVGFQQREVDNISGRGRRKGAAGWGGWTQDPEGRQLGCIPS